MTNLNSEIKKGDMLIIEQAETCISSLTGTVKERNDDIIKVRFEECVNFKMEFTEMEFNINELTISKRILQRDNKVFFCAI